MQCRTPATAAVQLLLHVQYSACSVRTGYVLNFNVNLWLQATALAVHWSPAVTAPCSGTVTRFTFVAYYTTHGSPYTSTHILIENTLVQYKMAKNCACMVLCCQNRVSKCTDQCYGLHSSASSSVHSASVTVLCLLKKKKKNKN